MPSLATQNHTASATSSGVISRPIGCLASIAERACPVVRPVFATMFPIVAAVTLMAFTAPVARASSIRSMMSSATPEREQRTAAEEHDAALGDHIRGRAHDCSEAGNGGPGQLGGAPGLRGPGRLRGLHADDAGGHGDVAHHHDGENDAEQEREPAQPPAWGQHRGDGQRQTDAGAPAGDRPDVPARLAEAGSQVPEPGCEMAKAKAALR